MDEKYFDIPYNHPFFNRNPDPESRKDSWRRDSEKVHAIRQLMNNMVDQYMSKNIGRMGKVRRRAAQRYRLLVERHELENASKQMTKIGLDMDTFLAAVTLLIVD